MNTMEHVIYNLRNSRKLPYPFPHFYCENVFPTDYYRTLQESVFNCREFHSHGTKYHGRTFADPACIPGIEFMQTKEFCTNIVKIFSTEAQATYPSGKIDLFTDVRLIRDGKDYHIGPHTDARWKLISLLFYLPPGPGYEQYGTSIYLPKDRKFTCPGGPHHPFEKFDKIYTAPFAQNSCLGFWKTNASFHGVETISKELHRDVLLFNVYDRTIYNETHPDMPPESQP